MLQSADRSDAQQPVLQMTLTKAELHCRRRYAVCEELRQRAKSAFILLLRIASWKWVREQLYEKYKHQDFLRS